MEVKPTTQQDAIYDWFGSGSGNLVVEARAGSGKTHTIMEGVSQAPDKTVLVCAYNKRIADELNDRVVEMGRQHVEARTLHSLGLKVVRKMWPNAKVDDRRLEKIVRALLGKQYSYRVIKGVIETTLQVKEVLPFASTADAVENVIVDYGTYYAEDEIDEEQQAKLVLDVLDVCKQNNGEIDFSDMVWLPIVKGWSMPFRYKMVVVDEAQDMSPVQITFARGMVVDRLVLVGDPMQCIYSWRGADQYSLDNVGDEVGAQRLPLSMSFRCSKAVVREAQRIVPDFQWAPWAPEGAVDTVNYEDIEPVGGDFVLSRTNAPLVSTCLKLRAKGIDARIEGKESLSQVLGVVEKMIKRAGYEANAFENALRSWVAMEVAAAQADGSPRREERALDINGVITTLLRHKVQPTSLAQRLKDLHQGSGFDLVTCSTVHKAKGLEANNVYLLMETLPQYDPEGRDPTEEEHRIEYVGISRAKHSFYWASKPDGW